MVKSIIEKYSKILIRPKIPATVYIKLFLLFNKKLKKLIGKKFIFTKRFGKNVSIYYFRKDTSLLYKSNL